MRAIILTLLTAIGLFFRFQLASFKDMWLDEVFLFFTSQLPLKQLIFMEHWDKAHPQFYFLFMHFWQRINTTPLFLRLPTIISFIPSSLLVFLIGKKICSSSAGFIATMLFSLNPFLVNLGWQERMYGFSLLFDLLFIYASLQIISSKNKTWFYLGIISGVLAFFIDYSFIWLYLSFLICLVTIFIKKGKNFLASYRRFLVLLIICSFAYLIHLPLFLRGFSAALELEKACPKPDFNHLQWLVGAISGVGWKPDILLFLWISFSLLGALMIKRKEEAATFFRHLLIVSFFAPILLSFLFSQISSIFLERNLMISSLLFVFGPSFLIPNFLNRKGWGKTFLYLVSLIFLGFCISYYIRGIKDLRKYEFSDQVPWSSFRDQFLDGQGRKLIVWIGRDGYEIRPLTEYYLLGIDHGKTKKINYFETRDISLEYVETLDELERLEIKEYSFVLLFSKERYKTENLVLLEAVKKKLRCNRDKCQHIVILK